MTSEQSESVRRYWTAARQGMITDDEVWGDLTAEPCGVDYAEISAAGLPAMWITPHGCAADRVLLGMHGGGFISGSMYTHRKLFGHLAKAAGVRALVFDYRLAPAHVHPAQVDDSTAVYRWLLDQGIRAEHIAFTGDSAGGGLAITTQLRAREQGLPLPAAALPFSPWVDLEAGGDTYNIGLDPFFDRDSVRQFAGMFLGPHGDPRDPLVCPLFADLTGIGPVYIQVGGDEALLADAQRLAEHASQHDLEVRIDVFPEMLHTFQMAAGRAPEADDAILRMATWVRPRLGVR